MLNCENRATLAVMILPLALSVACAAGQDGLKSHAVVARISGEVLTSGNLALTQLRDQDQLEALERAQSSGGDARAAVDAVRSRWAPAVAASQALASVHASYVQAIAVAVTDGELGPLVGLSLELLRSWLALAETARLAGHEFPAPPDGLRGLVGQ